MSDGILQARRARTETRERVGGFNLRIVWAASGVAWVIIAAIALSLLMHPLEGGEAGAQRMFTLLVVGGVFNVIAYVVPWRRLVTHVSWPVVYYAWSAALFSFSGAVVYLFPGLDSQSFLLYLPAILFVIATLDQAGQAIAVALGIGSFVLAATLSTDLQSDQLVLRVVVLMLVAVLGAYVTRGQRQMAHDNALLYEDSRRAVEDLRRVFSRFGRALTSSLDLDKTLHLVTDIAVEMLRTDGALLVLLDNEADRTVKEAASGERETALRRLHETIEAWLVPGIVRSRSTVQIPDVASDPRFRAGGRAIDHGLGSYLSVPLLLRGRVVGILAVGRMETGAYTARDVELLASFANQAAVAIENARLFTSLQERLRELSGLREISLAFASLTRLEDTYGQVVERIATLLEAEKCAILLYDAESKLLVAQSPAYGLTPEQVQTMRIPIEDRSAAARTWLSGRPYITADAQSDPRNIPDWAQAFGDHSLLVVPMRVEGKIVGLIRASNKRIGQFTNNDVRLLTIFASQAAVALRNAMLYREAAYERARLTAIFDHASDGIMIIDHQGAIRAFNRAMEIITGWQADEVIGVSCRRVCQTTDQYGASVCEIGCPLQNHSKSGELRPYIEGRVATKEGGQRDVGVSYAILDSPEGDFAVAIVRDISKAKELERVKSQFISAVSHELRTPLASIKACIGLLLESVPDSTPEPHLRLLNNIERSGRRLEALVADLLDLARLESGRVRLTRTLVDLRDVVQAATATIRPIVEQKMQVLRVTVPDTACQTLGDRQRLEQILLNLLSNAHKYTGEHGQIGVTLGLLEGAEDHDQTAVIGRGRSGWTIAVEDNGPGISLDEQKHIFERFYRAADEDIQRTVGSGLGLSIAKALVLLHGGRIGLDSVPGRGSKFYFSLPDSSGGDEDDDDST